MMSAKAQPQWHLTKLVNASRNHFAPQVALLIATVTMLLCFIVPKLVSIETSSSVSLPTDSASAVVGIRRRLGLSSLSASSRLLVPLSLSSTTPPPTEQEDLFISLKTSKQFHESRLAVVIKTWFQLARDQIWLFSDAADAQIHENTSKSLGFRTTLAPAI